MSLYWFGLGTISLEDIAALPTPTGWTVTTTPWKPRKRRKRRKAKA